MNGRLRAMYVVEQRCGVSHVPQAPTRLGSVLAPQIVAHLKKVIAGRAAGQPAWVASVPQDPIPTAAVATRDRRVRQYHRSGASAVAWL